MSILRLSGSFQDLELSAYDILLNLRPSDTWDPEVLVIGITKDDQDKNQYGSPVYDEKLHELLRILVDKYKAPIIGLDIYRGKPTGSPKQYEKLLSYMQSKTEIIGICRSQSGNTYEGTDKSPIVVKGGIFGFADMQGDFQAYDSVIRRHMIRMDSDPYSQCQTNFSLSYQIATRYLNSKGYDARWNKGYLSFASKDKTVDINPLGVSFFWGNTSPSGGYQKIVDQGDIGYNPRPYQIMLNYRSNTTPTMISISNFLQKSTNPEAMSDLKSQLEYNGGKKIILIGYVNDLKSGSSADIHRTPTGAMPGVYIQAHMVSQLIRGVLKEREFISCLPPENEIFLMWICSLIGSLMILRNKSLVYVLSTVSGLSIVIVVFCIGAFSVASIWMPIFPTLLVITIPAVLSPFLNFK
jgi:CHASE2 domain-containing sensor protein